MNKLWNLTGRFSRVEKIQQHGAAMTELLVSLPALLLLGLGGLQTALIYDAKTTINYATFEAARAGAVEHAQSDAIRTELGLRLAPLYGGDGTPRKAIAAITRSSLEVQDSRFTKIDIINPTVEAFDDFGRDIVDPRTNQTHFGIPNSHLRWRDQAVASNSGVNVQDANLLKIKTTFGYELKVPLMDRVIPAVMRTFDPDNSNYYNSRRIPITSVATVRMQSDAWRDENNVHTTDDSDGGATPPTTEDTGQGATPTEEEGQGGEDTTEDTTNDEAGDETNTGSESGESTDDTTGTDNSELDDFYNDSVDGLTPIAGDDQGFPSCDIPETPDDETFSTTSQSSGLASIYAGNPIHIVTGNKYQQEVDLAPLPGTLGLLFKRHYNSHSSEAGSIGHGWTHSYDLKLNRFNNGYHLRQSDGRTIHFQPTEKTDTYSAQRVSDGWLRVNETQLTWHWRNGQQMQFNPQGQLQRIVQATGQTLSLLYTPQGELFLVRDPQGRELSLDHYPNGRIKAFYDPSGQATRYRYDEVGNLAQVTRADGSQRIYHYEDLHDKHNLTGITDERGVRYATWAYDNKDRAIVSTHADQVEKVSLDFSTPGETKITDSQGKVSIYSTQIRNGVALVTAIHGPGCSSCGQGDVSYSYNEQLQLTEITTKDGITKHYSYDELGRTIQVSRLLENKAPKIVASYEYADDLALKPSATILPSVNSRGEHRIENHYNHQGQTTQITERGYRPRTDGGYTTIERTTLLEYNEAGNLIAIDGPRTDVDDRIQLSYDGQQRITQIDMADGSTQQILSYDAYGRPTKIKSGDQLPLELGYNSWGKPEVIQQGLRAINYSYDAVGHLIGITDPDGQTMDIHYDAAGRVVSMADAAGNSIRKLIDTEDRLIAYSIENSQGDLLRATVYLRDAEQRLRGVVTPDGIQRMVGYDKKGNKTLNTNGSAKGDFFVRTKAGSLIGIMDASGSEIRKANLANGHVVVTRDDVGRLDIVLYDDFGNKVAWKNPDSGLTNYQYDLSGNLIEKRDAAGNKTEYTYDAANQLTQRKNADGVTQFYYHAGRLIEVLGPESKQYFTYDDEGRVSSHTREIDAHKFTTIYKYDAKSGKLINKQLPGGEQLAYEYKANQGRLSAVRKSGWFSDQPLLEGITYEPFGNITGYTHVDGSRTGKSFDKSGRLIKKTHTQMGEYKLAYNYAGELVLIENDRQRSQYSYDAAGRLMQAKTGNKIRSYRYDRLGNHLSTVSDTSKLASSNADVSEETDKSAFDLLGRQTKLGKRRWDYNALGRPARLYLGEKLLATYRYNHNGERISKTVYSDNSTQAPKTTYFLYDMQRRLTAEANEKGIVTRQYLYLGRTPYAMLEKGISYSIQSDHLGSPKSITNEKGQSIWQADYDPFGRAIVKAQQVSFNLRRPGQYEDAESGLYDNYLRSYNPDKGRYLEPDPLGNLDGMNRYAYVGNSPLDRTDPLGLFKVHAMTGGDPVHEAIIQLAFERFNQQYAAANGGNVAFSQHTINLFIYANVRTDLVLDDHHQYLADNHFDNPTDGPLNDNNATWISDAMETVNTRRRAYGNISGEIRSDVCPPPGYEPIRENPDIMLIVESFGANAHTMADFYAHTNWVDETTRGGYYIQEGLDEMTGDQYVIEEGTVPNGLAMTNVWNERVEDYNLFSGQVDSFADIFGSVGYDEKVDVFENIDKSTHAYWEKDAPPPDQQSVEFARFEMARNLAIQHTLQEIQQLWDASENNTQLRAIYSMNMGEKETEGVQYDLSGCVACPTWGSFSDIDTQIDYVTDFVSVNNW